MAPVRRKPALAKTTPPTSELAALLEQAQKALVQNQDLLRSIAGLAREGRRQYTNEGGHLLRKIEVVAQKGLPNEPFSGSHSLLENQP